MHMPDRIASTLTTAQVAGGSGVVALSMTNFDSIMKFAGFAIIVIGMFAAQWWNWRRDVRERKEHAIEMKRLSILMDKHKKEKKSDT